MNLDKKQTALFDAVSGIDDDLIDEAATPRNTVFPRRQFLRIGAIAACLFLAFYFIPIKSLLFPSDDLLSDGFFVIANASENDFSDTDIITSGEPRDYYWSVAHSNTPGLPLFFLYKSSRYHSDDITFRISLSGGTCVKWKNSDNLFGNHSSTTKQLPSSFVANNKSVFYWRDFEFCDGERIEFEDNIFYIDIIIYANDIIIGYAVVEMQRVITSTGDTSPYYQLLLLAQETFDESSNVSEEYVNERVKFAKQP